MQQTRTRESGFTLIELMVVVAIIALFASMAVPNLMSSRATANESATVATLRTISSAEFRFKVMLAKDRTASATAEFGSLREMAGVEPIAGTSEVLRPALLSSSLGQLDANGRLMRQGYYYALYLPDASGQGVIATAANMPTIDPRMAQSAYSLVAWPSANGNSGRAAFFVNQRGDILKTTTSNYSGAGSVPQPGCALVGVPPTHIVGGSLASGAAGADGNLWVPAQ